MTPPALTTEAIMDALSNDWQPITSLIFKMQIKEMMDARFLQIKLKELERKDLILVETKLGKKHYKLNEPDFIIDNLEIDDLEIDDLEIDDLEFHELLETQSLNDAIASYESASDYIDELNEQDFIVLEDIIINIIGLNDLGAVFYKNGEYQLAMEANEKALKLLPLFPEENLNHLKKTLLRDIGNIFTKKNNHQEAIKYYESALELSELEDDSPFNQEVLFNLGTAYSNIKQPEKAIVCFEKIAKHDPELDIIWNALGLAYSANKEYDKAAECFEIALQFNPSDDDIIDKLNFVVDEMKKNEQFTLEVAPQELQDENLDSVLSKDDVLSLLKELNSQFEKLVKLTEFTSTIHIKSFINDQIKPFFENPSKKKIKKLKKSIEQHIEMWPEEKRKEFFDEYHRTIRRYEELQPPKWKKYGSGLLKLVSILR